MKIKTITCHDVYNLGASLQAYALARYLMSLGHDCEIINYKPDYLSNHHRLYGVANPKYDKPILREAYNLLKLPGRLMHRYGKRKKAFDAFTREYLPLTECRYASNDELKENPPTADVFFAGSDQIWNAVFQNGRDPAFYLDFAPSACTCASYAASFSTEDVPEACKPQIKRWLTKLDYISVREKTAVDIIERMGISGAKQVLDPVFLLNRDMWSAIATPMKSEQPYLLLYDFDRNPVIAQAARTIALQKHLKIYSALSNDSCDECFSDAGPLEFLGLIRDAEFVVSNSFHATAFSLMFEKQFLVFDRQEAINTRMNDLIASVGLTDQVTAAASSAPAEIDFQMVRPLLHDQIARSKEYIALVLDGGQK